jgi:hypothetical protein
VEAVRRTEQTLHLMQLALRISLVRWSGLVVWLPD